MTKTNYFLKRGVLFTLLFASFFILISCGETGDEEPEEPATEEPSEEPTDNFVRYIGEWNGNLGFTGVPISAKVEDKGGNRFEGDFFISSTFNSCCGSGDSDGSIMYNLEGNRIKNFIWNDIIPGCTGVFTGSGIVESNGDLEINITGTDCDGNHVATLSLSKQD